MMRNLILQFSIFFGAVAVASAQLVHPGLSHKKSDLERMKYQVEAGIEPWATSYEELKNNSFASYNYNVEGSPGTTLLSKDTPNNYNQFKNDGLAAYYNAIMWSISGDTRHADKAVECLNAWKDLTKFDNDFPLETGRIMWKILEGAEIIKSTYSGWNASDIQDFKDMLVYPGYSGTNIPQGAIDDNEVTFYWYIYNGDPGRHGNQGLFAMRGVMAIGIFTDNEVMYNRAYRYLIGEGHRADDLEYPSGPPVTEPLTSGNIYYDEFRQRWRADDIEDYGYNELIEHYIYENGQSQESSRDQGHALGGVSIITTMCEMAWNQGDDMYGHLDNRPLKGMEFYFRYNLSYTDSFDDQPNPWEPTVENGEFIERLDRTGRWNSLKMNPWRGNDLERWTRGEENEEPVFQLNLGHYRDRLLLEPEDYKWLHRGDSLAFLRRGVEQRGYDVDHTGWGHLTFHRADLCAGDPVSGFDDNGLPIFGMNVLPMTIEAENFDYFPADGEGRTYSDFNPENTDGEYRPNEGVDIQTCAESGCGYHIGWTKPGEWMNYTVYVPETRTYDISVRTGSVADGGKIQFMIDGKDKTGIVDLPASGGWTTWADYTVTEGVLLQKGVQSVRVFIAESSGPFTFDKFSITESSSCAAASPGVNEYLEPGLKYDYYEGIWDNLPDFESLEVLDSGITTLIELGNGEQDDYYGYVFDGYVGLEVNGDYTFYTNSDDGTKLYIDGVQIVTNDGTHGAQEEQGSICLQAGFHEIKVEYFDKVGTNDVLEVSYEGPGLAKQEIDELYHLPSDVVLATKEETPFDLIDIFPNPFEDKVLVKNPLGQSIKIEVFNSLGRHVFTTGYLSGNAEIDLSKEEVGIYILKVSNETEVFTKSIIKE